ncbi:MAG: LPS assembly protein LptD [Planctomycetota bacterium]
MRRPQRIVPALCITALLAGWHVETARAQKVTGSPDLAEIQPLIPPGISDFNFELFGKLAYTWKDGGANVIELLGNFDGRLGPYQVRSHDAVIWVSQKTWQDRTYSDIDIFLWQDAEIVQPAGTVERGPALIVTVRTFGKLVLNADGHAPNSDADSELFKEATKARRLLTISPAEEATTTGEPIRVAPTVDKLTFAKPKVIKQVGFSVDPTSGDISSQTVGDQMLIIATSDVSVFQGSASDSAEYVEIRADAAVLYLRKEQAGGGGLPDLLSGQKKKKEVRGGDLNTTPAEPSARAEPKVSGREQPDREAMKQWVKAVYLEGDVILTRGARSIRASRLYYDFEEEQALILDPVMRALDSSGKVPIYVRAERVRQLSSTQYEAERAQFTTSEFHTPHASIGAERLQLTDKTPRNEAGEVIGVQAGTYTARSTTLRMGGLPIAYWPFSRGDFSADRQAFRSAKFGYDGDFGFATQTRWYLFNLMGIQPPPGWDATLKLDYFTDRGPATGVDMDYAGDDYYGLVNSFYINDSGEDQLGPERSGEPPHDNRGRALWRHRQFLPNDLELTLEGSYVSDRNFMEQYERREFENGKDQETLAYLVKRQDNWQISSLVNGRVNDFQTQTEHLPDTTFTMIGQPLGDVATFYSENRAGVVRYKYDSDSQFGLAKDNPWAYEDTGSVMRGDTRQEVRFPVPDLGPLKISPYVSGRGSEYDDGPDRYKHHNSGNLGRAMGSYGVTGNTVFSKVDESIDSDILDLHHLRHIVKPDFAVWNSHANQDPDQMTPFDSGVEDISDAGGGQLGLRQRFQTKRGGPGNWKTVDWIVFDVEGGFFNNKQRGENTHGDYIYSRPEDSISSNFIATNFQYRISDSTVIVHDSVFDTNDGNLGTSNLSIAVEREPRLAYFAGWRYINATRSNILAGGANYKLSEKHTVGVREMYDIDLGRNYQTQFVYVRKWPRWYSAVSLDVDKALDDVGIQFSIWPEGAPRVGLGSKRYTGLADGVGMNLR